MNNTRCKALRFENQCKSIGLWINEGTGPTSKLSQIKEILRDDLYNSKDWKAADTVERVRWLVSMFNSTSKELEDLMDGYIKIIKRIKK